MNNNYIRVIDSKPDARKKGLRMVVRSVCVDDEGNLESIYCEYSQKNELGGVTFDAPIYHKVRINADNS